MDTRGRSRFPGWSSFAHRYTSYDRRDFFGSAALSIVLFALSLAANYAATAYASLHASNPVTDIVLSNTPVFEVDGFFVWGAVALIAFVVILLIGNPRRIPFTVYSLALFFFIRAFFITLTHIGPYPVHTPIDFTSDIGIFFSKLFFGDDLFFSGHTGAPFLLALLYWRVPILRYVFIVWSIFFAVVVLLGHIHYSIDVASAYFITYTIYHIAMWMFPWAKRVFDGELEREIERYAS